MSGVVAREGVAQLLQGFTPWAFQRPKEMPLPDDLIVARHGNTGFRGVVLRLSTFPVGLTGCHDSPIEE